MYVKRDENDRIVAVSADQQPGFDEWTDPDGAELRAFFNQLNDESVESSKEAQRLRSSDVELARVVEDIINLLTDKGVIQFTELPEAAQEKLLQRKRLRRVMMQHLDLVADDDTDQLMP